MTLSSFNLQNKGAITAGLLLIAISFILVIYGILFLLTNQLSLTYRQGSYDSALYLAEAGIEYYRWHLAHAPNDFTSGQGEHDFKDPQGEIIGKFNLEIETPTNGSSIVTIRSTGWLNNYPEAKRTIRVQYGIPSLTKYSFLSNASSWYGSGITVHGEIHSNNGIRMDGINTSIVSSVQKEYQCGTETGCSPTQKKPGVWGSGPNFDLWRFPSTPVDFDSVFFDLAEMKNSAISHGLYLNKSGAQGYHLVFKANGTFDVYKVNQTDSFHAYTTHEGCRRLYLNIRTQNFIRNYTVAQKPIIFVEDNTWVDGTVNGKVTVAAATFPLQSNDTDIMINNNLVYLDKNGEHSLGLIAHNDIIMGREIPENFEIDGALMAQNGKVIRDGYLSNCGSSSHALKDKLTIYGSILSNQKSYWNFGDPPVSGFITREITYDPNLLYAPPPYFPTDGEYEFISWEEE